jgi:hypothetical protein
MPIVERLLPRSAEIAVAPAEPFGRGSELGSRNLQDPHCNLCCKSVLLAARFEIPRFDEEPGTHDQFQMVSHAQGREDQGMGIGRALAHWPTGVVDSA